MKNYNSIFFILIALFLQSCKLEITKNWESEFYGKNSDYPRKVILEDNSKNLIVLGRRFRKDENKKIKHSSSLLKLSNIGEKKKELFLGDRYSEMVNIEKVDENYWLVGYKGTHGSNKKLWIKIVDENFNTIRDSVLSNQPVSDFPTPKILSDKKGNGIITFNSSKDRSKVYGDLTKVLKINPKFETIWEKEFQHEFYKKVSSTISFANFIIDSNDNLLIVGKYKTRVEGEREPIPSLLVLKINQKGGLVWRKLLRLEGRFNPISITEHLGDYYIVSNVSKRNSQTSMPYVDISLIKLTSSGELLFNNIIKKNIGDYNSQFSSKIISYENNGLFIIGYTFIHENKNSSKVKKKDNLIMQIDNQGNILFSSLFGENGYGELNDMVKTKNDDFIIIGSSNSNYRTILDTKWKIYSFEIK
jgi:hypothetical protein